MSPLDSAMGATVAHRAPEKVANRPCTQVWAWMINKCKSRMNRGEGYKTTKISQRKEGRNIKKKEERFLGYERSWELTSSDEKSFLPRTYGRLILCSWLLLDHRASSPTSRCPIRAQPLDPFSTN